MHTSLLYSALLGTFALSAQAATLDASYMSAVGGTFTVYDPSSNISFPTSSWVNSHNSYANLVGGYVALGEVSVFFGLTMSLYTGDGSYSPYGGNMTPSGGPVPSASLDDVAHTIEADLSALTWFWNGINFNQGHANATGTWDPVSGLYTVAWESPYALGYGFDGLIGQWTMTGVVMGALPVPEPEAYALMLAGLAMVGGMVGRRQAVSASR